MQLTLYFSSEIEKCKVTKVPTTLFTPPKLRVVYVAILLVVVRVNRKFRFMEDFEGGSLPDMINASALEELYTSIYRCKQIFTDCREIRSVPLVGRLPQDLLSPSLRILYVIVCFSTTLTFTRTLTSTNINDTIHTASHSFVELYVVHGTSLLNWYEEHPWIKGYRTGLGARQLWYEFWYNDYVVRPKFCVFNLFTIVSASPLACQIP